MIYVEKFKLKKELYNIKPFTIKFKDGLNLIVGDNGCGKSTILKLLFDQSFYNEIKEIIITDDCQRKGVETKFFDTEKQNPRTEDIRMFSNPNGTSRGIGIGAALQSHYMSHGEVIFPIINAVGNMKNMVIFIDEPEAGVSLINQKTIYESLLNAVNNKCQLFVSTHSYILIKNSENVFDLENRKWIESAEYLKKFEL